MSLTHTIILKIHVVAVKQLLVHTYIQYIHIHTYSTYIQYIHTVHTHIQYIHTQRHLLVRVQSAVLALHLENGRLALTVSFGLSYELIAIQ